MNNYSVLHLIDGILIRTFAVRPSPEDARNGPRQWLFLAEPKTSFEVELARLTTVLSDPVFPTSEKPVGGFYTHPDGTRSRDPPPATLESGAPLPVPRHGQVAYSADWRLVQILSGIRAYLLVLIDSCGSCAQDSDYVGNLPIVDTLSAIKEMNRWSESDFVPNAKYWKDWPLAKFLRNPLPPVPASWKRNPMSPLFSGATAKYVNRLAAYPADRDNSFVFYRAVFGLAQSKRGFAPVPKTYVRSSMQRHAEKLSTPPVSTPDLIAVRKFARSFLGGLRIPRIFEELPRLEGSTKACVENPRNHGGARGLIRAIANTTNDVHASEDFNHPQEQVFLGMTNPHADQVFEERGETIPLTPNQWRHLVREGWTQEESIGYLSADRQIEVRGLIQHDPTAVGLPLARVAPVLEPLKVRLITAMDGVRTHVARPVQRALWRHLRTSPIFRLIGEPVSESIITDMILQHRANGGGEDPFVSGDYSAATDGLDIRVSEVFIEEILEHLQPEDLFAKDFIASILLKQVILYPGSAGVLSFVQQNGQLMGSVLSFPILCLANAFAYAQSLPNADQVIASRRLIDRMAVLINGDDILFRSSNSHFSKWQQEISKVGFVPSVGKNFRHERFLTVNSIPIEVRPVPTPYQFWKNWSWADMDESPLPWVVNQVPRVSIRGFLNVGLLTGQAKLTGRDTLDALPISGWHAGSVLDALNPPQAHKWFLHYHLKDILQQTRFGSTTLNIFAHPLLGGLGFQVPEGVEPRFSHDQRRIASALFANAMESYSGQEGDFKRDSLVFLDAPDESPLSSLGSIRRKVEVEMYPVGTPLPEGYSPFEDKSGVKPLAFAHAPNHLPEEELYNRTARCRLSSRRLKKLTRAFGDEALPLHPLDKMTEFPFFPVRVTRSTFIQVDGKVQFEDGMPAERPFVKVYAPGPAVQESTAVSDPLCEAVPRPVEVSDWEMANTVLIAPVTPPEPLVSEPPKLTRSTAVMARERSKKLESLRRKILHHQNLGLVYTLSPLEEELVSSTT